MKGFKSFNFSIAIAIATACFLAVMFLLGETYGQARSPDKDQRKAASFICERLLAVTGPTTFSCDLRQPYPSTRLHDLIRKKISIRLAGVIAADQDGKTRKEQAWAAETKDFLEMLLTAARRITLENVTRDDEAFQLIADVLLNDQLLRPLILQAGWVCPSEKTLLNDKQTFKKLLKGDNLFCFKQKKMKRAAQRE